MHSGRIDNLYSTFCALESIVSEDGQQEDQSYFNIIGMFDHEECGS